jgi:glutaredoxin
LPFSLEKDLSTESTDSKIEPAFIQFNQNHEKQVPVSQTLLLLFIRSSCPSCSPAKDAAERLGIPVHMMNADTEEGRAEAIRRKVLSTPTAILLSPGGEELARAVNAETIGSLLVAEPVAV